jgi:hypothetical protein
VEIAGDLSAQRPEVVHMLANHLRGKSRVRQAPDVRILRDADQHSEEELTDIISPARELLGSRPGPQPAFLTALARDDSADRWRPLFCW